jgi:hypothetical protein
MSPSKSMPSPSVLAAKAAKENTHLDAYFITGFSDGEGCFHIIISQNNNSIG